MTMTVPKIVDPWSDVPPRLKIRLLHRGIGMVTGLFPKQVDTGFSHTWNPAFGQIYAQFAAGVEAGQVLVDRYGDLSSQVQELTRSIWGGVSNLDVTIPLSYISRRFGSQDDVIEPVNMLLQMCGARTGVQGSIRLGKDKQTSGTSMLRPQPMILEIGYAMAWKYALPKAVNWHIKNISQADGMPTRIDMEITFQTDQAYVVDQQEVEIPGNTWEKVTTTP